MTSQAPVLDTHPPVAPPASPAPALAPQLRLATSFDGILPRRDEWDAAVTTLGGTIYLTFDWLQTWWEHYGRGARLRLFLFEEADRIVGILPLYLETFGSGPLRTVVARLVGANIPPKAFNPPIRPDLAGAMLGQVIAHLFDKEDCDLLSLGGVTSDWIQPGAVEAAAAATRAVAHPPVFHTRDVSTRFRLPSTFDEYLASLGSSERKNRLKRLRSLDRNYRVERDIVAAPDRVEAEFDTFAALHADQWRQVGKGGHFEAWPGALAYNRDLVRRQARHGRVQFFRLLLDGRIVASRYTFRLGNTLYSELPARAVGDPWDGLGIGAISLIRFTEQAIEAGIREIDSGLGSYTHKTQLGGDQVPVGVWRVTSRRPASRLKVRAFHAVGAASRLLLHKLWYRRLLPRLPAWVGRSQSLSCLRFDA
ncbi:MAG: GNAT family N-acetyltransferase [Verrucomicrobiae bacterium]|nr:GNAT family N-acetyltransferase [Verrucomicrobiae bacterium]